MPRGTLTLPGRLLARSGWPGTAQPRGSCSVLECASPCSVRTNEIPWRRRGKTDCAGSLLLAPLSLRLRPRSQVCDLQGNSLTKGARARGRWGDGGPAFPLPPRAPSGRCSARSCVAGEDGAGTQKQLPDLSFPEPGLKGAVVAVGDRQGCVRSATPAASTPRAVLLPRAPRGSAPLLSHGRQTPMRSCPLRPLSSQKRFLPESAAAVEAGAEAGAEAGCG